MSQGQARGEGEDPGARRREDIARRLHEVRARIERACAQAGRDPAELTLIAVTKFFPASDIDLLAELGVHAIGENRDQEAAAKIPDVSRRGELEVHFIGQLQTNKSSSVAQYADVVHSVDRSKLVRSLDRAASAHGRRLAVLVQVSLDAVAGRGGAELPDLPALADEIGDSEALDLRGVMAVAPLGADPDPAFARLQEAASGIRDRHPEATWISAGMSADLEQAIAHGATHLRVGSAILGSRQSLR
jgi:pyridoxal phosphate enzyme (YggS family)